MLQLNTHKNSRVASLSPGNQTMNERMRERTMCENGGGRYLFIESYLLRYLLWRSEVLRTR